MIQHQHNSTGSKLTKDELRFALAPLPQTSSLSLPLSFFVFVRQTVGEGWEELGEEQSAAIGRGIHCETCGPHMDALQRPVDGNDACVGREVALQTAVCRRVLLAIWEEKLINEEKKSDGSSAYPC